MRKMLSLIVIIVGVISLLNGCMTNDYGQGIVNEENLVLEEIQNEIIRFHVLANSDTEEDQELKLKVRDKVIEEMSSKLIKCNNVSEAREIMLQNIDEINSIAKKVIDENGYNYSVKTELSRENFPDKMYGDMLFPQGEYEALRILIGEAEGQNWWCVMFPPLCFVDEGKQAVNSSNSKESLEKSINTNNDNIENISNNNEEKIEFKFKIVEILKGN